MTKRIIAIDPGGTTGIAIYDPEADRHLRISTYAVPIDNVLGWVDGSHKIVPFETIVMEPFRTAGRLSKYGLETIDLVGQLKGWAYCRGVEVILYPPQSRKAWLPASGVKNDEPTQHQQDAKAHLLHRLKNLGIKVNV